MQIISQTKKWHDIYSRYEKYFTYIEPVIIPNMVAELFPCESKIGFFRD